LVVNRYLVLSVSDCMSYHAGRDWTAYDAPALPNSLRPGQDI